MLTPVPRLEMVDSQMVPLSGRVEIYRRFRAIFDGDYTTTIEVEVVDRQPQVRSVILVSDDNLADHDLRPPVRSKLLPAAVRAACVTQLGTPHPTGPVQRMRPVRLEDLPATGMIGPIRLIVRARSHADEYAQSTKQALPRGRGRPRHQTEPDDLQQIADILNEGGKVTDLMSGLNYSRSTAYRRRDEARHAGLLNEPAVQSPPT